MHHRAGANAAAVGGAAALPHGGAAAPARGGAERASGRPMGATHFATHASGLPLHHAQAKRPRYSNRRGTGEWNHLNMEEMGSLWTMHRSDPIAVACAQAIVHRLLSGGIVFTTRKYDKIPSEEFVDHVNRNFVPFCADMVHALLVQGFAPWVLDEDMSPRVIPFGCADLRYRVNPDAFKMELAVFDEDGELMPDIFWTVRNMPDAFGKVTSSASTYYGTRVFKDTMWRNVMVADYLRARPPLFTSTNSAAAFEERDVASVGEVDGLRASLARDNTLVRNRIVVDAVAQQDRLVRMLNEMRADTGTAGWRALVDPLTGLDNADRRLNEATDYQPVVPLAADARAVVAPQAESRTDLVALNTQFMLIACVAYGCNAEAIGLLTHGGVQSAESMLRSNAVLDNTVRGFRQLLTAALVDLYQLLWGAAQGENAADITVVFPSLLDMLQLEKLYNSGLLRHDAYREFVSEHLSISANALEKREMLDPEQRALAHSGVKEWTGDPTLIKKPIDPNPKPKPGGLR